MTQEIELVVFENVSVMHQKALSLPFGKVSLRQLLMLSAGMLGAVIAYSVTGEIWYPTIVFGGFFALGMITTKVLTLDQMLKSTILFLIKGTSLSKKPQYMISTKKQSTNHDNNNNTNSKRTESPAENKNIIQQTISQIESLFGKKSSVVEKDELIEEETTDNIEDDFQEEKRYSVDVTLQSDNVLQISNLQDHRNITQENPNNTIEKFLSLFKKTSSNNFNKNIPELITVYLNGTKLAKRDYTIHKKDKSVLIPLNDDSEYSVIVNDENNKEIVIVP